MALARFEHDATDEAGNLLTGVTVEVRRETGGLPQIYSDRAGTAALGNPFVAADGKVAFHAPGGAYKITLSVGAFTRILRYVAIGRGAETDLTLTRPAGAWDSGTTYDAGDLVNSSGKLFISRIDANLGNAPDTSTPGDTDEWMFAGTEGGLAGSTGSTDNRLLRADGTGGATVQASAVTVDDSGNMSGVGTLGVGAITTTGLLTVNGQIKFPATQAASTDANTLDDYEEGTYTPTWTAPSSNPAIGNGTLSGAYTKVGRLVSAEIKMLAGSTTTFGGGAWTIGLPFTASALNGSGAVHGFDSGTANRAGCCVAVSTTGLQLESDGAGGSWGPATPQGWAVNDYFNLTYVYPAS